MWRGPSLVALVLALAAPARAATLYVDDGAPSGGDGSRARPFASLQAAIDAAAPGDDIQVAEGTYEAISVTGKEVRLSGGYDADFTVRGAGTPSVIQGTADAATVTLYETGSSVLDGFVIRGGLRGVVIDADFMSSTNAPELRDNVIEQNGSASSIGGGIYADHCDARIVGNTVRANQGDRGSGIASQCQSLLIEDNVIEDNVSSGDHGGGLYLTGASLVVRGNLVRNNEVGVIIGYGWGAGVTVFGLGVSARFERNVWTANLAQSVGSGAFVDDGAVAVFDHDLFYANRCGTAGGAALYVNGYDTDVSSRAELIHVTIADHPCEGTTGNAVFVEDQSAVTITNSILWGNAGDDFFVVDAASSIRATYTLSEEPLDGVGNLSADPLFADPAAGDFHVRSTSGRFDPATGSFVRDTVHSPSIDVGDPTSDYAMEPGPNGMRVNLGHTGNTPEASMGGPGGTPPSDAGVGRDAGPTRDAAPSADADTSNDGGPPVPGDASEDAPTPRRDSGTSGGGGDADGCGCRAAGRRTSPGAGLGVALLGVALVVISRRARPRGPGRRARPVAPRHPPVQPAPAGSSTLGASYGSALARVPVPARRPTPTIGP
ncbi:MAG: right-handed parallel beta-helix repeat-containing protein [Deltaproteobacteria bacterium]|nr:right-handed parallel beta-helix repeat-containing protein [Deltaproteobacteria bacterium]